jgi:sugar phosphate isomerase/epimerase
MAATVNFNGAVGLYSISVRGFDVPELLAWAESADIPFIHLRGGPRGVDLAAQDRATVRRWRRAAARTVPITGVTADLDIADLVVAEGARRAAARAELDRLAETAAELDARWVRLLARTPPSPGERDRFGVAELPGVALPLVVELHHPHWLLPGTLAALHQLLTRSPNLRLLADTAQLSTVLARSGDAVALGRLLAYAQVLHLSDNGSGLAASGHAAVAAAARGRPVEVAVEWTGADRSPAACLARYRACVAWWQRLSARPVPAPARSPYADR